MSLTPILGLTELEASQSQPELVVNAALRVLEVAAQLSVLDYTLAAPPGSPADGDRYIIAATASGVWLGHEDSIALCVAGAWVIIPARKGMVAWVESIESRLSFQGVTTPAWAPFP